MPIDQSKNFFDRWPDLPGAQLDGCPPDSVLVDWAKASDQHNAHLDTCERCQRVVAVLHETIKSPGNNLQQFLTAARARAHEVAGRRQSTAAGRLWAYLAMRRSAQIAAFAMAAVLLLLIAGTILETRLRLHNNTITQDVRVSFDDPQYTKTIRLLRQAVVEEESGQLDVDATRRRIQELNPLLQTVGYHLLPARRAELADLTVRYQRLIDLKYKGAYQRPSHTLMLTPDAQKVNDLLQTVASTVKTPEAESQTESHVVAIQDKIMIVRDSDEIRDPATKKEWHDALRRFANSDRVQVDIQNSAGKQLASFAPGESRSAFPVDH